MKDMEPWVVGEGLWAREGAFVGTENRTSSIIKTVFTLSVYLVSGEFGVREQGVSVLSSGQSHICLDTVCVWGNLRLAEEAAQCL